VWCLAGDSGATARFAQIGNDGTADGLAGFMRSGQGRRPFQGMQPIM
jgi:hypothetical protein